MIVKDMHRSSFLGEFNNREDKPAQQNNSEGAEERFLMKHPLHLSVDAKTASSILSLANDCEYFFIAFRRPEVRKCTLPVGGLCFTFSDEQDIEPKVDEDNNLICVVFIDKNLVPSPLAINRELEEGSEVDEKSNGINSKVYLYCTNQFLQHYGWEPSQNIVFRKITPFSLQKVILTVKDLDTYKAIKNLDFHRLLPQVCKHGVLVRTNDLFLALWFRGKLASSVSNFYQHIVVTECCPFRQGLLTAKTEIFTVHEETNVSNPRKTRMDCLSKDSLFFSTFCPWSNKPKDNNLDTNIMLPAKIVGDKRLRDVMIRTDSDQEFDPNYIICISRKLMLANKLFDGSLVEVYCIGNKVELFRDKDDVFENDPEPSPKRTAIVRSKMAMVKCLGRRYDKSLFAFISPILLFNIQVPPQHLPTTSVAIVIKKLQNLNGKQTIDSFLENLKLWNIVVAKKVTFSLIKTPGSEDLPSKDFEKYFTYPRLMEKGDVFCIRIKNNNFSQTDLSFEKSSIFYLKVENIKPNLEHGDRHLVHPKYTHRYIKDNCNSHSFIPYLLNDSPPYWCQSKPAGLESYVENLLKLILPFLNDTLDLKVQEILSPTILISGPSGVGKTTVINAVARTLCLQVIKVSCQDLSCMSPFAMIEKIKNIVRSAKDYSPCILVLKNLEFLAHSEKHSIDTKIGTFFVDILQQAKCYPYDYPMLIIGTTENIQELQPNIPEGFLHHMKMQVPSESDRAIIFTNLTEDIYFSGDVSSTYISRRTAGYVLGDIVDLVKRAQAESFKRVTDFVGIKDIKWPNIHNDLCTAGVVIQHSDFENALDSLQSSQADELGTPKIPNVKWDDIGGLHKVKQDISDTIQLPLQHPELFAADLRRSGVLLYGPPGTGKTLIAKAVATEYSLNFFSVRGPELMNKYVGQSEENVRRVFQQARDAAPSVIFFDELDSLAPNRGRSGDSGGVMDRIVSQLLAELDGLHKSNNVFVIGATNRVDLLDPALLRPGRFDKILYMGICPNKESQLKILQAVTRKFVLGNFSLKSIVDKCSMDLTGADFYALASDAWMNATKKIIQKLEDGRNVDTSKVVIEETDFLEALSNLVSSVSETQHEHYKNLQNTYAT
ncbi:peroxisome assembly factor 2-like [Argonauta hians]